MPQEFVGYRKSLVRDRTAELNDVMTPLQWKIMKILRPHIDELNRHITELDPGT